MKKLLTTLLLAMATLTTFAVEPPEGSFSWGLTVPLQMDYLSSDTLSVTSSTISQFTVTYELLDTAMAHYIAINGDVVTVLNHYAGDDEATQGKIFIKAVISGMTGYDDTELTTYIRTHKIFPAMQWTNTLGDMPCGSSVFLSAVHGNTDNPDMKITYTASDNVSTPSRCVTIDQDTSLMTAVNIGTGITITAKIDSTDNYRPNSITYISNDSIVRFNVVRGNRVISWDSTDFASINNFSIPLPLELTYFDNQDSATIVSSDNSIAEVIAGNLLKIHKAGTVTLTASVAGTANYYDAVSDTTITIPAIEPLIAWDENVITSMDRSKKITSTTCDMSMNIWVTSNYGDRANYRFTIPESEQDIATVVDDTTLCCFGEGTIHVTAVVYADGRTSQPITHDINIYTGAMEFVRQGNWNDVTCWSRSDLASHPEQYNVNIVSRCTVPDNCYAECKGLKIYANGSITIEPHGRLVVQDSLINYGSETSLCLKADSTSAAQVVMSSGNPLATVGMYLRHSVNGSDTVWSNHGVSLDKGTIRASNIRMTVKTWDNGWNVRKGQTFSLNAYTGYLIADTMPRLYSVDGRLLAENHTYSLHRASGSGNKTGRNFITNSYSAPIDISAIEFIDMKSELFEPVNGQYRTLPRYTASTMGYGKWMHGSSLFADAMSNDSRIDVDYDRAVRDENENIRLNMLRISVTGNRGYSDTLVLMNADFCSELYDDGYDGSKWEGDTCMPQIYANTPWGNAAVNVEQSLVSQRIGFRSAHTGETYTIRFHTEGLDSSYRSLYLFDTRTQEFTDIIAHEEYTFTGSSLGENDRFTIMSDKVVPKKDKYGRCIMVMGDKVLLVGFENSDMPVRVITFDGKVVCQFNTKDGPWLQLPELVTGFYFINVERCSTKFFR